MRSRGETAFLLVCNNVSGYPLRASYGLGNQAERGRSQFVRWIRL